MLQYDYLWRLRIALTRMQTSRRNRICFLFRYLSNHWSMFTKLLQKWERKNLQQDTCSSSLFQDSPARTISQNISTMGWWQILESVLKYLDVIDRRLSNKILNGSLWKRFRFLSAFSSLTLRFTLTWPFVVVTLCAPQSNKSSRAKWNCLHSSA